MSGRYSSSSSSSYSTSSSREPGQPTRTSSSSYSSRTPRSSEIEPRQPTRTSSSSYRSPSPKSSPKEDRQPASKEQKSQPSSAPKQASKQASGLYLGAPGKQIDPNQKPTDAVPHSGRPYAEIKAACVKSGELYCDKEFDAITENIFYSKRPPKPFVWKRPKEIVEDPQMFVGGASRFDIAQGVLGDCWLLAAVASLCQYQNLFHQVVPKDASFDDDDYCGAFCFRFWQYGRWEEVVVDDRLPTYNNKLVFLHSAEKNEFWSALLEKAYAKLCGSYEALKGGATAEAMEDFTGGVTETFSPQDADVRNLFKILCKAQDRQSLMGCSIDAKPNEVEAKAPMGLIKGHAYTITDVKKVSASGAEHNLLRIRNPWGNEHEWTGAWSDESIEWKGVTDYDKKKMGITYDDDGEFWMCYEDFERYFTKVEVCMLSPDSAGSGDKKSWAMEIHQGSWQKNVSAGGCRNYINTFALNPQYNVILEDPDDDEDVDNCTVVIGVIQKGRRLAKEKNRKAGNLTIGFSIYQITDDSEQYKKDGRLSKEFFQYNKALARSKQFVNTREVTGRFSLPPGEYALIPSTFKALEEGEFVMRMFSEKPQKSRTIDTKTQIAYKPPEKKAPAENGERDPKLARMFDSQAGEDGEIDAFELQVVLNSAMKRELGGRDFSLEAARSLLLSVDEDRNGVLNYDEFEELWETIMSYKQEFKRQDTDESGDFSAAEMRTALANLDFKLSTPILSSIVLRFSNKKGAVNFDDFVQIICKVKSGFEKFKAYQGKSFTLDDYIMSSIYI